MTCETKEHMDEQMHKSQYPQPEPADISQSGKPLEHHVFFGSRVKQWTQAASCWSSIDGTCSKVFPKLTIVSRKGPPHWQYLAWKWWNHFRVCPELGYLDHGIPKWRECLIGNNNDTGLYLWGTKPKKSLPFELWCRPVWCSKSPVALRVTKLRL